jgi:TetR/AcrR family transcriptional repressor of nem operon
MRVIQTVARAEQEPTMGHSKDDKTRSHDRIVEIAAARIRESGTAAPGVAEIMKAAGLTHGGFYKHFASRDDLIAEAADKAFADGEQAYVQVTDGAEDPLAAFVDWYASDAHCENPGSGCAVGSLAADASRSEARVQVAYRAQVERYLAHLEELLGGDEDARRRAVVSVSALVGSVMIARGAGDPALADEVLRDVRDFVKSQSATALA